MIASASEIVDALETTLSQHLAETITALGWDTSKYGPVETWQQLPTLPALSAARFPAGAISTPNTQGAPVWSQADRAHRTTWRVAVGIYDRGRDHDDTARRIRNWCAAVRLTVRAHRTLGGVALSTTWAGERYELMPNRDQARTFAGGAVAFDVTALVTDTLGVPPLVTQTPTPSVSVH
jgi:hypothetical protein